MIKGRKLPVVVVVVVVLDSLNLETSQTVGDRGQQDKCDAATCVNKRGAPQTDRLPTARRPSTCAADVRLKRRKWKLLMKSGEVVVADAVAVNAADN